MTPTSSVSNFFKIFLSVWVNNTVGVCSTENFLKVYGHFSAQIVKYLTLGNCPKRGIVVIRLFLRLREASFQSA